MYGQSSLHSVSDNREYRPIDVAKLSHDDCRRFHEEMFRKQHYEIKRDNLVVFCALNCRTALNLNTNIFVRFVDTEIVSFLEERNMIKLVSKSNFSKLGDIFTVTDPYSKSDSRIRYREDREITDREHFESRGSKKRKLSEYSSSHESLLQNKINDLEREYNRLFGLFQEKESTINRLSSQLENKTKEHDSLLSFSEQLKEKISDLNTAIDYTTEEKKNRMLKLCAFVL